MLARRLDQALQFGRARTHVQTPVVENHVTADTHTHTHKHSAAKGIQMIMCTRAKQVAFALVISNGPRRTSLFPPRISSQRTRGTVALLSAAVTAPQSRTATSTNGQRKCK